MKIRIATLVLCLAAASLSAASTNDVSLSLENVIRIAEQNVPQLKASHARWIAAEHRARQAGLPPNPQLVIGAEGFRGRGSGEYVAGVSQSIPLGSQRRLTKEVAAAERDQAGLRFEAARSDVRRRAHGAFATALFAQESEKLHGERLVVLESRLRIATARSDAGDQITERAELAHADLDHEQLDRESALTVRRKAFLALATVIGQPDLAIVGLRGELELELGMDEIRRAADSLDELPGQRAADREEAIARLRAQAARASRIPSLNLKLLYRRDQASRKNGMDIGVGFAIPLFDRKKAAVKSHLSDADAAREEAVLLRQQTRLSFEQLAADLEMALKRSDHIREEILPHHAQIVARHRLLFSAGETDRDSYDAARLEHALERRHYLDGLREVHRIWAALSAYQSAKNVARN
ncbi:MAG: TolC family protein [Verrucomicrobiia bacterium]|jgi:cobalt-zinc-cadmium efflux system outer membrane protein